MSDNEETRPCLRKEIFSVNDLPLSIIPDFIQRPEDGTKRPSAIVREESGDVLKKQIPWPLFLCNPSDLKYPLASAVLKSEPLSSNAESLARESRGKQVKIREFFGADFCRILPDSDAREMSGIDCSGISVNLAGSDDLMSASLCGKVKTAYSGKK